MNLLTAFAIASLSGLKAKKVSKNRKARKVNRNEREIYI